MSSGPTASPRAITRGLLLMAGASTAFAFMASFARMTRDVVDPWLVVTIRSGTVLVMAIFALWVRGVPLRFHDHRGLLVRAGAGTIAMGLYFTALTLLPVAEVLTLQATSPLFVALFSRRSLGEVVGTGTWGILAIGFAGVVAILGAPSTIGLGSVLALGAALAAAWAYLAVRALSAHEHPDAIVVHFSFVGTAVALPLALARQVHWRLTASTWLELGAMGLAAGLGQLAMTRSYAMAPAALVSGGSYVGVPVAAVLGILLFGERPSWGLAIGGSLIVLAGLGLWRQSWPASR